MKTNRKKLKNQRQMVDAKLKYLFGLRLNVIPEGGWVKTVRNALGLTAAQLAKRLKIPTSNVLILEKREAAEKVNLSSLQRAAKAMNCRLVWAIVPEEPYQSLSDIVEKRAQELAEQLVKSTDQSMRLEAQGIDPELSRRQAKELAEELVRDGDPRIWEPLKGENNDR
jgi:predicted DNA-binding mobile mystery protein A